MPFWKSVMQEHTERFSNISQLAEIALCLPMNTACCERAFSAMKMIKNDWRACLHPTTLSTLMRIAIEGPDCKDYNPDPAVKEFWESGQRAKRPNQMD